MEIVKKEFSINYPAAELRGILFIKIVGKAVLEISFEERT